MGERRNGIAEVRGSTPLGSTILPDTILPAVTDAGIAHYQRRRRLAWRLRGTLGANICNSTRRLPRGANVGPP